MKPLKALSSDIASKIDYVLCDLDADLLAELRVASVLVPREAGGGSPSGLVERALRELLELLRDEHHGGKPFPAPAGARLRRRR